MSSALCRLVSELNPYSTTELLPEWERAVGLPDSCFLSGRSIEERRADVVRKLGRPRYTLIETWRGLARQMGIDHAFANRLEVSEGTLTGRRAGPVVDRRA